MTARFLRRSSWTICYALFQASLRDCEITKTIIIAPTIIAAGIGAPLMKEIMLAITNIPIPKKYDHFKPIPRLLKNFIDHSGNSVKLLSIVAHMLRKLNSTGSFLGYR